MSRETLSCPRCFKDLSSQVDDWNPDQDDQTEVDCEGCGLEILVTAQVTLSYETQCSRTHRWNIYKFMKQFGGEDGEKWHQGKVWCHCMDCEASDYRDPSEVKTAEEWEKIEKEDE